MKNNNQELNKLLQDMLLAALDDVDGIKGAIAIGSCLKDINQASDIDYIVVTNRGYERRFFETIVDGKKIEVEFIGMEAFRSYRTCYYWYTGGLIMEKGKFINSLIVYSKCSEFLEELAKTQRVSLEERLFVLTYNIGMLLKLSSTESRGKMYLGTNKLLSICSIFSAIKNVYPVSMTFESFHEQFDTNDSAYLRDCVNHDVDELLKREQHGFLDWCKKEGVKLLGIEDGEAIFYYPQNKWGWELLQGCSTKKTYYKTR
ncbi:MAG: hypothetical protein AB2809_13275 [Candidatus Thiodiazotropha sp.]